MLVPKQIPSRAWQMMWTLSSGMSPTASPLSGSPKMSTVQGSLTSVLALLHLLHLPWQLEIMQSRRTSSNKISNLRRDSISSIVDQLSALAIPRQDELGVRTLGVCLKGKSAEYTPCS